MSVVWGGAMTDPVWVCAVCGSKGRAIACSTCGIEEWASDWLRRVLMQEFRVEALAGVPLRGTRRQDRPPTAT